MFQPLGMPRLEQTVIEAIEMREQILSRICDGLKGFNRNHVYDYYEAELARSLAETRKQLARELCELRLCSVNVDEAGTGTHDR